jgi:ribosomal protein L11 methyltransferase
MTTAQHYQEWMIPCPDPTIRDLLSAYLWELGFEGIEEGDGMLKAYGLPEQIQAADVRALLADHGLKATLQNLPPQNWNAQWEASFEPVQVDSFCRIRAAFHSPESGYQYELCITPKMSFGTGHHATTRMMIRAMQDCTLPEKAVLDFGSGTGVLAILAEQMGATRILAIENDEGAVENMEENKAANACTRMESRTGSLEQAAGETFDLVLANINRNILIQYASGMAAATRIGGTLLISGILIEDVPMMREVLQQQGFGSEQTWNEGNWACMRFKKTTFL